MFDIGHNRWNKIMGDLSTLLPTKNFMNLILLRLKVCYFSFHMFHKEPYVELEASHVSFQMRILQFPHLAVVKSQTDELSHRITTFKLLIYSNQMKTPTHRA